MQIHIRRSAGAVFLVAFLVIGAAFVFLQQAHAQGEVGCSWIDQGFLSNKCVENIGLNCDANYHRPDTFPNCQDINAIADVGAREQECLKYKNIVCEPDNLKDVGESCSFQGAQCLPELVCDSGFCRVPAGAGDSCGGVLDPPCDANMGLICEGNVCVNSGGGPGGPGTGDGQGPGGPGTGDGQGPGGPGTGSSVNSISIQNPLRAKNISELLDTVAFFLFTIAVPLTTIMILYGAFQLLTSSGNEERIKAGRKTLLWAVIGITIVLVAGGIASLISNLLGGAS